MRLGGAIDARDLFPSKERWRPSTIPWRHLPRLRWIARVADLRTIPSVFVVVERGLTPAHDP